VHAVNAAPSREHWKLAASVAVKPKLAVVAVVGLAGLDPIAVSGAIESIVHV
jgi:hypothetical protein